MIIIRNNRICHPREYMELERHIRRQGALGKVLVIPEYCEVLAVGKGDPEIVLVDHNGNQLQVQKHGHWCWEGKFKACSECGSYVEWDETLGASFWNFCPYCGAKMDLTDKISGSPDPADPV